MQRLILDLDTLRSFVAGIELGSFAKAADRLGRSTSAVSAQLKKLEQPVDVPILRKAGRGLVLTPQGEVLFSYAKRLLDLNNEAITALQGADLQGYVRLGLQEDLGEHLLTQALGVFARTHPRVRIEARVARNAELLELIGTGQLDLVLAWDSGKDFPNKQVIAELPMEWIGPRDMDSSFDGPVPLVAFENPCLMREVALQSLDKAGIPWRLAFTSTSLNGIWAAVGAGLGITIRTRVGLPANLCILEGMPELPGIGLMLVRAVPNPTGPIRNLEETLLESLGQLL